MAGSSLQSTVADSVSVQTVTVTLVKLQDCSRGCVVKFKHICHNLAFLFLNVYWYSKLGFFLGIFKKKISFHICQYLIFIWTFYLAKKEEDNLKRVTYETKFIGSVCKTKINWLFLIDDCFYFYTSNFSFFLKITPFQLFSM